MCEVTLLNSTLVWSEELMEYYQYNETEIVKGAGLTLNYHYDCEHYVGNHYQYTAFL